MPFKLTLFGLEISKNPACKKIEREKELKKMVKKKLNSQQERFKKAQKACHSDTSSPKDFGKCMKKKLTNSKKNKKGVSK